MLGGMSTPEIGAVARRTRLVSRRDIELFTEISGDRNPIHYDEEVAAASRFGGLVVQGGVTSGLLNAVVAEDLPGPGSVFLEVAWKFLAPVRPGDEITAEVTVTDARADKPVTTLATRITNQDGVVVLDGSAVVWRDPAVAAAFGVRRASGVYSPACAVSADGATQAASSSSSGIGTMRASLARCTGSQTRSAARAIARSDAAHVRSTSWVPSRPGRA